MAKDHITKETVKVGNICMSLYGTRINSKVKDKGHLSASQFSPAHPWLFRAWGRVLFSPIRRTWHWLFARELPDTQARGVVVSATVQHIVDSRYKRDKHWEKKTIILKWNNTSSITTCFKGLVIFYDTIANIWYTNTKNTYFWHFNQTPPNVKCCLDSIWRQELCQIKQHQFKSGTIWPLTSINNQAY